MFEGRTLGPIAVVTGASSGIGEAFAHVLSDHDHDLVLIARNKRKLYELRRTLEERYQNHVFVISADLTQPDDIRMIHERLKTWQLEVDVLVNNAGLGDWGLFQDCDWEKQERMIGLNILSMTHLTRLLLPSMIAQGSGIILNVASTAAFQPGPWMSVYFATKAFCLSFSQALADELQDKGVTVTCLCPGPTATRFQESASMANIRLDATLKPCDPMDVARCGYLSMLKGRRVSVVGSLNQAFALGAKFLPSRLAAMGVRFMQSPK